MKAIQSSHQRRVPALKVLSAIAICKDFKDTEEKTLDSNYFSPDHFSGCCDGSCDDDNDFLNRMNYSPCAFCRFVKWIQVQKLPRELKVYCKNVLRYLGQKDKEFIGMTDTDEEDEFLREVDRFGSRTSEEDEGGW